MKYRMWLCWRPGGPGTSPRLSRHTTRAKAERNARWQAERHGRPVFVLRAEPEPVAAVMPDGQVQEIDSMEEDHG